MISNIASLPVILPLISAVLLLLWRKPNPTRRFVAVLSSVAQVGVAFLIFSMVTDHSLIITPMGGWGAPYGIGIVIDRLSSIMLALCQVVAFFTILYTVFEKPVSEEHPFRLPLTFFIIAGISLSFTTGDLFNMFVAFEIMLIASYALLTLEIKDKNIRHAFPYLAINLVGGTLFLCAGAMAYSLFGSLSFAGIAVVGKIIANSSTIVDPRLTIFAVMLLLVFGLKAGFFPMYYWLPRSYSALPIALGALFSAMLTKVGVYAIIRLFSTLMPETITSVYTIVLWLSIPTMIFGILAALIQTNIRKILCFNLISHIGFMMLAIAIFTPTSVAGAIMYAIHHVIVITTLFLLAGILERICGSGELNKMGQIWSKAPFVTFIFFIQSLSLAGLPPLSGFWGKWIILKEALGAGYYIAVGVLIFASVLTLWSLIRILFFGIWQNVENKEPDFSYPYLKPMLLVSTVLVIGSISIGLYPDPYIRAAKEAAVDSRDKYLYAKTIFDYDTIRVEKTHESSEMHAPKNEAGHKINKGHH